MGSHWIAIGLVTNRIDYEHLMNMNLNKALDWRKRIYTANFNSWDESLIELH